MAMEQNKIDYAAEFDRLVDALNKEIYESDQRAVTSSLSENRISKPKKDWKYFWEGFCSVLNIGGNSSGYSFVPSYTSTTSTKLSAQQQDAVALASDLKRVDKTLDEILLSGGLPGKMSVDEAKEGKRFVEQMYNHHREVYISHISN